MERTLLISHNWHNRNDAKWLFWLEKKLTELGFSVSVVDLPMISGKNSKQAIATIQTTYGIEDRNVHVVRHDPGALTLLKYCEQLLSKSLLEPTMLVAGMPKHNSAIPTHKLLGGATDNLTLATMNINLVVIYGGQLVQALSGRKQGF